MTIKKESVFRRGVTAIREVGEAMAWRATYLRTLAPREPVVLMYHGVPRRGDGIDSETFEKHVRQLSTYCQIIPCSEINTVRHAKDKIRVILTFDDGFQNNAEVAVPVLRKYRAPALFFVNTRHCQPGRFLWFAYLNGLQQHFSKSEFRFAGESWDMRRDRRAQTICRLRKMLCEMKPHPTAMYKAIDEELPPLEDFINAELIADNYVGMSEEQISELAADRLFEFGVHTLDHPFLTRCELAEIRRQLEGNKAWIERLTARPCSAVAYPGGDYDEMVIAQCIAAQIDIGYAVEALRPGKSIMEMPRIGLYTPSNSVLATKVFLGSALRELGFHLG